MDDKRVLNVTVFHAGCEYPPDHSEPVDTRQAAKPCTSTSSTSPSEKSNAATEKTPSSTFRPLASLRPETACTNVHVHPAILSYETKWIVMHGFLRQHGYEMRARYQPDWVPSWEKKGLPAVMTWQYEDGEQALARQLDAVRVADSLPVMMKIVTIGADHSPEYARFFAEEPRGSDPRNHCLPLLDVLFPPAYPASMVLIYRRCVPWNIWPFSRVSEVTEFMTQVLEGLAFMHENDFVHLDASERNIVMDGLHLYLEPCHPVRPKTQLEDLAPARHMERHQSHHRPVKYYFIDFETSIHFATPSERRLVTRKLKQDKSVPEEKKSADGPVDPFAVDVYCIGNMIIEHWLKAYRNVEFVRRLAEDMVSPDPAARPTAQQALARFIALRDALSGSPSQLRKGLLQIPLYHSPELQAKALIPAARKYAKERKKDEARQAEARKAAFAGEKAEQRPSRRTLKSILSSLSHKAPGSDASTPSTKLPALQPDVTAPPRV